MKPEPFHKTAERIKRLARSNPDNALAHCVTMGKIETNTSRRRDFQALAQELQTAKLKKQNAQARRLA